MGGRTPPGTVHPPPAGRSSSFASCSVLRAMPSAAGALPRPGRPSPPASRRSPRGAGDQGHVLTLGQQPGRRDPGRGRGGLGGDCLHLAGDPLRPLEVLTREARVAGPEAAGVQVLGTADSPGEKPWLNGEYGTNPMPSSRVRSRTSPSTCRSHGEYSVCKAVPGWGHGRCRRRCRGRTSAGPGGRYGRRPGLSARRAAMPLFPRASNARRLLYCVPRLPQGNVGRIHEAARRDRAAETTGASRQNRSPSRHRGWHCTERAQRGEFPPRRKTSWEETLPPHRSGLRWCTGLHEQQCAPQRGGTSRPPAEAGVSAQQTRAGRWVVAVAAGQVAAGGMPMASGPLAGGLWSGSSLHPMGRRAGADAGALDP